MHHPFPGFDLHNAECLHRMHCLFVHCGYMQGWLHFIFSGRDPNLLRGCVSDKLGGNQRADGLCMQRWIFWCCDCVHDGSQLLRQHLRRFTL